MSRNNRLGVSDVLGAIASRRRDFQLHNPNSDSSSSSENDDSDGDEDFRPRSSESSSEEEYQGDQTNKDPGSTADSGDQVQMEEDDGNNGDDGDEGPSSRRKRSRKANPANWKKTQMKDARQAGLEYANYRGVTVPAKSPKPVDCTSCRFKCSMNISEDDRKTLCSSYYAKKVRTFL